MAAEQVEIPELEDVDLMEIGQLKTVLKDIIQRHQPSRVEILLILAIEGLTSGRCDSTVRPETHSELILPARKIEFESCEKLKKTVRF